MKRPWFKRIEVIAAFIIAVGGSGFMLLRCGAWAKETGAAMVAEERKRFFIDDHKPIIDSMERLKKDVDDMKSDVKLTRYYLEQKLSNDDKMAAQQKMANDALYKVR